MGDALDALTTAEVKVREAMAIVKSVGRQELTLEWMGGEALWLCGRIASIAGYTIAMLGEMERRPVDTQGGKEIESVASDINFFEEP